VGALVGVGWLGAIWLRAHDAGTSVVAFVVANALACVAIALRRP
jgi:hypothetical protein